MTDPTPTAPTAPTTPASPNAGAAPEAPDPLMTFGGSPPPPPSPTADTPADTTADTGEEDTGADTGGDADAPSEPASAAEWLGMSADQFAAVETYLKGSTPPSTPPPTPAPTTAPTAPPATAPPAAPPPPASDAPAASGPVTAAHLQQLRDAGTDESAIGIIEKLSAEIGKLQQQVGATDERTQQFERRAQETQQAQLRQAVQTAGRSVLAELGRMGVKGYGDPNAEIDGNSAEGWSRRRLLETADPLWKAMGGGLEHLEQAIKLAAYQIHGAEMFKAVAPSNDAAQRRQRQLDPPHARSESNREGTLDDDLAELFVKAKRGELTAPE